MRVIRNVFSLEVIPFLALSVFSPGFAEPYEGLLQLENSAAPIWMEARLPTGDGPVAGAYFYKRIGKEIPLQGTKRGQTLSLSETGAKEAITGTFAFTVRGDSLVGGWKSPKETTAHPVALVRADPVYRRYAVIPKPGELKLADGKTLADAIREYTEGDEKNKPWIEWRLCRKGVLSVSYNWEFTGAYPTTGSLVYTFDLATRKEIVLDSQIEPAKLKAFDKRIHDGIQAELTECRKAVSDSEWNEVLADRLERDTGDAATALDRCFRLESACNRGTSEYYFTEKGLEYWFSDFFQFPHVIRSMDCSSRVAIPYADLKKYLRSGSPLLRFAP
jgi:hypothetical protein